MKKEEPDELDMLVLEAKVNDFEDRFNSLSYYSRLREIGIDKEWADVLSEQYDILIYSYVKAYLRKKYHKEREDYNNGKEQ